LPKSFHFNSIRSSSAFFTVQLLQPFWCQRYYCSTFSSERCWHPAFASFAWIWSLCHKQRRGWFSVSVKLPGDLDLWSLDL